MGDNEFLNLLEQNLGRRWPKEWRTRLWNMAPAIRPMIKHIRGSLHPEIQQDAINRVRAHAVQQAIKRLS